MKISIHAINVAIRLMIAAVFLALSGCASLQHAGTASYSMKPVLVNDKLVCCEVTINNGKQYARLDATLTKTGDDYAVTLSERGVEAFRGQEIAADAVSITSKAAVKAAAIGGAVLVAPIAGAALMSGTTGAAAVGVGSGVLLDKATTP